MKPEDSSLRARKYKSPDRDYRDGVDLTLIRWMLSMSPVERLRVLQQAASSLQKLRNANYVH